MTSSALTFNGPSTLNTAIDVPSSLLLAILCSAEPVLAVTTRYYASKSEDPESSFLEPSDEGDYISSYICFDTRALKIHLDG